MHNKDRERAAVTVELIDPLDATDLGQGIAEYVIILAVIVVTGIVLVTAFGGQLTGVWNSVTTQFGALA